MYKVLNSNEIKKIDKYWQFIKVFNDKYLYDESILSNPAMYRYKIIKKIKKKYSIEKFFFYEQILNKLLWQLLTIYNINIANIKFETNRAFGIRNCSYINKIILFESNKIVICSYGTVDSMLEYGVPIKLFKILNILVNRDLYEQLFENFELIDTIITDDEIKKFYYPHDYPFPNINLFYNNTNINKTICMERIKAYYYQKDDSSWYNIIVPSIKNTPLSFFK